MTSFRTSGLVPVILAGGKGTRLWPLSQPKKPKQFLPLTGSTSLLEQALMRCSLLKPENIIIVGSAEHQSLLKQQVQSVGIRESPVILLEPFRRDTALPVALSCIKALEDSEDPVLCIMPADAFIPDGAAWKEAINRAVNIACRGYLTLIGIEPTRPEVGYGYINAGKPLLGIKDSFEVFSFKEKPDLETAEELLKDDKCFWNSGIFIVKASVLKTMFEVHAPKILEIAQKVLSKSITDSGLMHLDSKAFEEAVNISFDYAIMEHIKDAAVLKGSFIWSDLGSWASLKEIFREGVIE